MSIVNNTFTKIFRILLLSLLMMTVVQESHAMMPKAGLSIGTRATITYRDSSNVLQRRDSDVVLTTIAQVYQVEVTAMHNPARAEKGENADIPFQVKNVGNGLDDVTFSVKTFPNQVDKVTFFSADAGGAVQPGIRSANPIDCASSAEPATFSKVTNAKVSDGDCIWYRVSVTNLPAAGVVHDVQIVDPVPEYSSYTNGARTNQPEASPSMIEEEIVTKSIDLAPDSSLILTYPVTVNFRK